MQKVIRNDKVAVLYSPGYGAGWYSWHNKEELVFHPVLVELVEADKQEEITEELCQKLLNIEDYICVIGSDNLTIKWLEKDTFFRINEYDGAESIVTQDTDNWLIA